MFCAAIDTCSGVECSAVQWPPHKRTCSLHKDNSYLFQSYLSASSILANGSYRVVPQWPVNPCVELYKHTCHIYCVGFHLKPLGGCWLSGSRDVRGGSGEMGARRSSSVLGWVVLVLVLVMLPGLRLVQTLLRDAHDLLQDATDVLRLLLLLRLLVLLLLLPAEAVELHHGVGLAQLPLGQSDGTVQHHVVVVLHRCTAPGTGIYGPPRLTTLSTFQGIKNCGFFFLLLWPVVKIQSTTLPELVVLFFEKRNKCSGVCLSLFGRRQHAPHMYTKLYNSQLYEDCSLVRKGTVRQILAPKRVCALFDAPAQSPPLALSSPGKTKRGVKKHQERAKRQGGQQKKKMFKSLALKK